jgi:hypothetical protein
MSSVRNKAEFIPSQAQDDRINNLNQQTNDLKGVLFTNINKLMGREKDLNDLHQKTEDLEANAVQFSNTGVETKKKMRYKNIKWKIILILVIILIVVVIALAIGLGVGLTNQTIQNTG